MTRVILGLLLACSMAGALVSAQASTPYKLGTFERDGRVFVGVVLRESVVIDFARAHAAIPSSSLTLVPPVDMKDLIVRYETGLRDRIVEIVGSVEATGATPPPYAYALSAVKILPPIMYPMTMLNVAVNYAAHDAEMAVLRDQVPGAGPATAGAALAGTVSAPRPTAGGILTSSSSCRRRSSRTARRFGCRPAACVLTGNVNSAS